MYIMSTNQVVQVGVTRSKVPATALPGRKYLMVQNVGGTTVFLGNSGVTADTAAAGGFVLLPYGTWQQNYSHRIELYAVVAAGSAQLFVEEGK